MVSWLSSLYNGNSYMLKGNLAIEMGFRQLPHDTQRYGIGSGICSLPHCKVSDYQPDLASRSFSIDFPVSANQLSTLWTKPTWLPFTNTWNIIYWIKLESNMSWTWLFFYKILMKDTLPGKVGLWSVLCSEFEVQSISCTCYYNATCRII